MDLSKPAAIKTAVLVTPLKVNHRGYGGLYRFKGIPVTSDRNPKIVLFSGTRSKYSLRNNKK
jgi:hypothetical protein